MALRVAIGEGRRTFDMLGGKLSKAKDLFEALDGINSSNGSTAGQGGWAPVAAAWNKLHPSVMYDRDYEVVLGKLFDAIAKSGATLLKTNAEKVLKHAAPSCLRALKGRNFSLGEAILYGDGKCIYSILNTQDFKNILESVGVDQKSITKFINRSKSVTPARLKNSIEAAKAIPSLLDAICEAPDSPDAGISSIVEIKRNKDFEGLQKNTNIKCVRIANGISNIPQGAFNGCTALKEIIIPPSVRYIFPDAFQRCAALKEISIPERVEFIGYRAFCGCESLKEMVIPSSLERWGVGIFEDCRQLEKLVIQSNKLQYIPYDTFKNCTNLTEINIPDVIKGIDSWAFYGCENLKQITIPKSVKYIGMGAFSGCPHNMIVLGDLEEKVKTEIQEQLPNARFNDNN